MMPSKATTMSSRLSTAWGFLDLGHDRKPAEPHLVHDRVDVGDIGGRTDEGQGDDVGAEPQRPAQVLAVLLGQGGDADGDPGQVDPLVVRDEATLDHLGDDVGLRHRGRC